MELWEVGLDEGDIPRQAGMNKGCLWLLLGL